MSMCCTLLFLSLKDVSRRTTPVECSTTLLEESVIYVHSCENVSMCANDLLLIMSTVLLYIIELSSLSDAFI